METTRLLALSPVLADEMDALTVLLRPLREALKTSRPHDVPKARIGVESYLRTAPSMSFVPSWIHLIARIGGRSLHAREVLRRVTSILDNDDLKAPEKGLLIESLESDLQRFETTLRTLEETLGSIDEEPKPLAAGAAEIGVLYPSEYFGDLDEFAHEVADLNRHLRPLLELSGESGNPRLRSLETGTLEVFLTVTTTVGALVATIIWRLLRSWQQVEEIRKLRAETRKVDAEAAELLERRSQHMRDEAIQRIHKDVMDKAASSVDSARRNELEISVRQSIAFIDAKIQLNVLFEVSAPAIAVEDMKSATEPEKENVKLIQERGAALWQVQAKLDRPMLPVTNAVDGESAADCETSPDEGA